MKVKAGRDRRQNLIDELSIEVWKRLGVASKNTGFKHDASGTPVTTGYMHGPGGLLSYPGVDPDVFHTIVGTQGILNALPTRASTHQYPLYETLTGVTADQVRAGTAEEPAEPCDDAPQAGQRKGCITFAPFGLIKRGTREIEINRLGQTNDRADPLDLNLIGSPIGDALFGGSNAAFNFTAESLRNELVARLQDRAMAFHLKLSQLLWTGSLANNTNGYKEFVGLERLVNTGYVDAITNQTCPSIDSDVKNFGSLRVDSNGGDLVNALTYMLRYVRSLATKTGVMPVRWAFAMREELLYEITKIWPCSYFLGGCTVVDGDGQRIMIDARDQVELRDQMRAGRFLLIDGMRIDVLTDDAIPYDDGTESGGSFASGCFRSDIYLLPLSVQGRSTLFLEYFQYNNPSIQSVLGMPVLAQVNGAFLETPRQTNQCVVFDAKIEPRLVLRTPWLAGKLENVVYCPLQMPRQPFPEDPYHVDGGVQTRSGPSYYKPSPWTA